MKTEHARLCGTKKSRAHLVEQCRALALYLGCEFESKPGTLAPRGVSFAFWYGPYRMFGSFDGDSRCDAFIGHWHIEGSKTATFPKSFANVNPYHYRKATTCADTFDGFLDCIRRGFTDIQQRETIR